jgi:hypothetical protein
MSVSVDCGTGGCPCVGSVLVTAYACLTPGGGTPGPLVDDALVLSALVTKPLRRGTALGFRFYPHDENYLSVHASAVTFTLSTDIPAGSALTLQANSGTPSAGMELFSRPPAGTPARPVWPGALVGRAGSRPAIGVYFSVFVYWSPSYARVEGISALGLVTGAGGGFLSPVPVLPPTSVVPCKYAFAVPAPSGPDFVFSLARAIPGTWRHAWRVLKWDTQSMWDKSVNVDFYNPNVGDVEDERYVQLQPGQLAAVAYKPYDYDAAPAFSGQLVLVTTELVPAGTVAFIRGGSWPASNSSPARSMAHWVWTAPTSCALLPGTVIDIGGLRPGSVGTVNIGTMSAGELIPGLTESFFAYTVFSAAPAPSLYSNFMAVTGVYPCAYMDTVPHDLVPGVSILSQPWPDCAAILSLPCCNTVDNWACFALQLQHACATRWLCQPLPAFGASPCGTCGTAPCCCGGASRTPYASFPATARAVVRPCCGMPRT